MMGERWEYKTTAWGGWPDSEIQVSEFTEMLNSEGADGWQLVTVVANAPETYTAIWKRQR